MSNLYKYLKKYKKHLILGPIFKLLEAIFELIVPVVMAKIIDVGIANAGLRHGTSQRTLYAHKYAFDERNG